MIRFILYVISIYIKPFRVFMDMCSFASNYLGHGFYFLIPQY